MTKFLATLPPDLHRWLKIAAAERGMSMNDLLVSAITNHRQRLNAADVRIGQPATEKQILERDQGTGRPPRTSVWTDKKLSQNPDDWKDAP